MTIEEALAAAAARLLDAGVADPGWDAGRLLTHVLGWSQADLIARGRDPLPSEAATAYELAIARRAARVPLQHITGVQAFWRHDFEVSQDVLVPRPETELVVEAALEIARTRDAPRVADVGTGSGCIALSVAAERKDARVVGIDLSAAALRVAARNAARLRLASRVPLVQADLLSCVRDGALDLVLANPPYVETDDDWPRLSPEVREHEPRMALVPPGGAAAFYGRLFVDAARATRPGGGVVVEIGRGQEERLVAAGRGAGLDLVRSITDLQGIPRVLVFSRA